MKTGFGDLCKYLGEPTHPKTKTEDLFGSFSQFVKVNRERTRERENEREKDRQRETDRERQRETERDTERKARDRESVRARE